MYIIDNRADLPSEISESLMRANVFYSKEYDSFLRKSGDQVYYIYNSSSIIACAIRRKYMFRYAYILSEPFMYRENLLNNIEEQFFLDSAVELIKQKTRVQWIAATPNTAFFNAYPNKSERIPFGNYVIDLNKTEEELFAGLHTKHRNSVRKAAKSEIVLKHGGIELLDDYMKMDSETWQRSDRNGQSKEYYFKILDALKDNAIIFIAYKDYVPQGGAIFYYNREMAYYMFGASKNKPESGAMNLLHWGAIKYMKSNGVKRYSFVGCRINEDENSKYHDIQRFKKRFGGELIEGYLFKAVFKNNYYRLFNFLIMIKNKSRNNPDVIEQELHKWPELQINQ